MPSEELTGTRIEPVFPLTIHLPGAGYKRIFADLPALKSWAKQEETAWADFFERLPPNFRNAVAAQRSDLRQLNRAANRLEKGETSNDLSPDQNLARAVTTFSATKYIPAQSTTGQMIIQSERDDTVIGVIILCAMRDEPFSIALEMGAIHIDLTTAIKLAETARLITSSYRQYFESEYQQELAEIKTVRVKAEGLEQAISVELVDRVRQFHQTVTTARGTLVEIEKQREAVAVNLETLEQRYKVDKEYGKAIAYWSDKRKGHDKLATGTFTILVFLFIAPLLFLGFGYEAILTTIERLAGINEKAWIPLAAVLSLAGFCYVGLVRLIGRLNRENSAEHDDAHLRETLINTYLALRLDPTHPLNDGERLLALHAMFRGSARAPTADDTPPVNTLEALINTLKPGGGKT